MSQNPPAPDERRQDSTADLSPQPSAAPPRRAPLSPAELAQIDELCAHYEARLGQNDPPSLEEALTQLPPELRERALLELIQVELSLRGEPVTTEALAAWIDRFPEYAPALHQLAQTADHGDALLTSEATESSLRTTLAAELAEVLDQYQSELTAGRKPYHDEWLQAHPEFAEPLKRGMLGLDLLHGFQSEAAGGPRRLGDFRLIREIGRGGMGAVYEAEQCSLGRRVAVKVLWRGAMSDPDAIRRFQREASTVAKLHHTNIVPIFSVGTEGPINYYAMQLIDGKGLDVVWREHGEHIEAPTVALWGLQAAEALAHAHQRGVVHRDVKPSNLLLDRDHQIWLTDFGLAKQSDDVTLSLAGAILGTPRYMSPEQAAASLDQVDHRTDIYSLGATMYELATGRPVFSGNTPHAVIHQILHAVPPAARDVQSAVPRDFNTIVMKCLAKAPSERYASAAELAQDLRAFLEGRPITARRPTLMLRTALWFRRQRRLVTVTLSTVALTVAVLGGSLVGFNAWQRWHEGELTLQADRPPVVAEISDSAGSPLHRPFTVPTQDPLRLPAGNWLLRTHAAGMLSQDIQISIAARQPQSLRLQPERQLLGAPRTGRFEYGIAQQPRGATIVSWDAERIHLEVLGDGQVSETSQPFSELQVEGTAAGLVWPPQKLSVPGFDLSDKFDLRPWIVEQAQDVDQDEVHDVVLAMRHQALVSVISPQRGVLWSRGLTDDVRLSLPAWQAQEKDQQHPLGYWTSPRSTIVERPFWIPDIDQDQAADLIVNLAYLAGPGSPDSAAAHRVILALSGKTGRTIWSSELPRALFDLPSSVNAPYAFQWFIGPGASWSTGSTQHVSQSAFQVRYSSHPTLRQGNYALVPQLISNRRSAHAPLTVITPTHYGLLDPLTGRFTNEPIPFGLMITDLAQQADLDADGTDELLVIESLPRTPNPVLRAVLDQTPQATVIAWSMARREPLWKRSIPIDRPLTLHRLVDRPAWPVVADLDGDQRLEIVLPTAVDHRHTYRHPSPPYGYFELWDGSTGKTKWRQQIASLDLRLDHCLVGPDIDGDGTREVLTASLSGSQQEIALYADAWSGSNGKRVWTARHSLESPASLPQKAALAPESPAAEPRLGQLQLISSGVDGWPQFIVPLLTVVGEEVAHGQLYLFSTRTGGLAHVASEVHGVECRDLNGDGQEELALRYYRAPTQGMAGGTRLTILPGLHEEPVHRLGRPLQVVSDLDRDGLEDLVELDSGSLRGISSQDGRVLWQLTAPELTPAATLTSSTNRPRPERSQQKAMVDGDGWDLDGDKVRDLLLTLEPRDQVHHPLWAVSGRTGQVLWQVAHLSRWALGPAWVDCRDLNGDNRGEVIYYGHSDWGRDAYRTDRSSMDGQLDCAVFAGPSGALMWRETLSAQYGLLTGAMNANIVPYSYPHPHRGTAVWYLDANRDHMTDLVVLAEPQAGSAGPQQLELQARDGRNGQLLWQQKLPAALDAASAFTTAARLATIDLESDGQAELISVDVRGDQQLIAYVTARDGRTGQTLWTSERAVGSRWDNQPQRDPRHGLPQVFRRSAGAPWIGLVLRSPEQRDVLWCLDHRGQTTVDHALSEPLNYSVPLSQLQPADLDGDGMDECVLLSDRLKAWRLASADPTAIWEFADRFRSGPLALEILPPAGNGSLSVAVLEPSRGVVQGFDGLSGRAIWSSRGHGLAEGKSLTADAVQLVRGGDRGVARVLFNDSQEAVCRGLVPAGGWGEVGAGPSQQGHAQRPRNGRVVSHDVLSARTDPRTLRPLPWTQEISARAQASGLLVVLAYMVLCSVSLCWLPLGWILRAVRGRLSFRGMLGLPLVVACALSVLLWRFELPLQLGTPTTLQKFALGLWLVPPIYLAGQQLRAVSLGRWREVVWMVLSILVCSVAIGGYGVWQMLAVAPLEPGERLDPSGWGWIVLWGLYATSLGRGLWDGARWLGSRVWWALKTIKRLSPTNSSGL